MKYLLTFILSYMVVNPVYAEVADRMVLSWGFGWGYPIAMEAVSPQNADMDNLWKSGVHIGGSLGYILDKRHRFILSSSIDYTNYRQDIRQGDIIRADQSLDVVSLFTDLKMRLRSGEAKVMPYVKGGVGLFRAVQYDHIRDTSSKQNKVGFGVDAGVDLALSERAGVFAEAQYQVGLTNEKMMQHMPFKVGLFLW